MSNDEKVFPKGHRLHNRIVYDRVKGRYYDKHTDLYLTRKQRENLNL